MMAITTNNSTSVKPWRDRHRWLWLLLEINAPPQAAHRSGTRPSKGIVIDHRPIVPVAEAGKGDRIYVIAHRVDRTIE